MRKKEIIERLKTAGIDEYEAYNEAGILIEELFGISAAGQLACPDADFSSSELSAALTRRAKREPLAYILGYTCFCGQRYAVSPECLIPRPETELIVEKAANILPAAGHFADIGCGSGCIAISLICRRPDLTGDAVDVSKKALALAKKNAAANSVYSGIFFTECDVLKKHPLPQPVYNAIISNPPYIRTSVISGLEPELSYEPVAALDGGIDGLVFYRTIISEYKKYLAPDGAFIFEIGFDQAKDLAIIAEDNELTNENVADYSGKMRLAVLKRV